MSQTQTVFADTLYWVSIVRPNDPWRKASLEAKAALGQQVALVTTDEVMTEFLTVLRKGGDALRKSAVEMVRAIYGNPNVKVLPQSRETFLKGLHLYGDRLDKEYSHTDCVSMNTMRLEELRQVLTNDHHFAQEGFDVLIRRDESET